MANLLTDKIWSNTDYSPTHTRAQIAKQSSEAITKCLIIF